MGRHESVDAAVTDSRCGTDGGWEVANEHGVVVVEAADVIGELLPSLLLLLKRQVVDGILRWTTTMFGNCLWLQHSLARNFLFKEPR